jgi:lipoxygenase
MKPHFRYTLKINANARSNLINAGSVIENAFSPGPWGMRFASKFYATRWRFVDQALDIDLTNRGMVSWCQFDLLVTSTECKAYRSSFTH